MAIAETANVGMDATLTETLEKFAKRLSFAIDARDSNQSKLSRATGMAQTTISAFTRGTQRAYFDQMACLANELNVTLDYIAGRQASFDVAQAELSEDERTILAIIRDTGLSRTDVVRALVNYPAKQPPVNFQTEVHSVPQKESERDSKSKRRA